jgi:hypothetical protein
MGHDINNLNQSALLNLDVLHADKNLTNDQRALIDNAYASVLGSASIIENVDKQDEYNEGSKYTGTMNFSFRASFI